MTAAAPVRLPRGSQASVAGSPVLAAAFLGGPAAAVLVAAIGTFELRELRGEVPWYGTLYNHATFVIPALAAASVYLLLVGPGSFTASVLTLAAAFVAGVAFLSINALLSSAAVAVRSNLSIRAVLWSDLGLIGRSMLAYSPLAWLMAVVSISVGQWAVVLFGLPLATTRSAYQRVVEIRNMFTQTISSLSSAVDARDHHRLAQHVVQHRLVIGVVMRVSEAELEPLEWGGLLHDIGKIGVRDAVLLKPDRLNKEERTIMNKHPETGEEILRGVEKLAPELPLIRHHHEWYNGSGYPDNASARTSPSWRASCMWPTHSRR